MKVLRLMTVGFALAGTAAAAIAADPPLVRGPRAAALPAPIVRLVSVQPFRVASPWVHEWRADRPEVREGWIVVLEADPSLVRPRQTEQAVLMAGAMTLEVVHVAVDSGTVVAILPRDPAAEAIDLAELTFHLATPALPESLTVAGAESRGAAALAAGIAPRGDAEIARARAAGGDTVDARDREGVDRAIGATIRRFLPADAIRADELEGRIDPEPRSVSVP